jgi:hypothetical protein
VSKNKPSKKPESRVLSSTSFHAGFFLCIFFHPEDRGDVSLRNIGRLSTDYTALYLKKIEFFITTAVRTSNHINDIIIIIIILKTETKTKLRGRSPTERPPLLGEVSASLCG